MTALNNDFVKGFQKPSSFELVLIDGLTRCGKSSLSEVLPTFSEMEHIQFSSALEGVMAGLEMKTVTMQFAQGFLTSYFNELSYNMMLSRNVNFRKNDQTGIHNFIHPEIYIQRLERIEGPEIFDEITSSNRGVPIQTHDLLTHIINWEKLYSNYKIISLWRNPIELVYSWWQRGWGDRFFNRDPSNFTLQVNHLGSTIPWYCFDLDIEMSTFCAPERCIIMVEHLLNKAVTRFRNASFKERVILVKFERLCTDPMTEIERVSKFLQRGTTQHTFTKLEKANLPRNLSEVDVEKKFTKLRGEISNELSNRLEELQISYSKNLFGLESEGMKVV